MTERDGPGLGVRSGRRGKWSNWAFVAILFIYLAVGAWYSVSIPLGEAPDELAHFRYIRYVAEHGRGPRTAEERDAVGYKGHEPPLYYVVCSAVTSWVDTSTLPRLKEIDPDRYPRHSIPDEVLIRDAVLHTEDEAFPYRGAVLVWHLARLLSLLMGVGTLVVVYLLARDIFPRQPHIPVVAVALTALAPQYVYLSSVLNNDNLAVLFSSLALWVMVRIARGEGGVREYVLLGALIGLGRLTKFYTIILLPMALLAIAYAAWRSRSLRKLWTGALVTLIVLLLVSASWLWAIEPDYEDAVPQGWGAQAYRLLDVVHMERWFSSSGRGKVGGGVMALPKALLNFWRQEPGRWAVLLFKSYWAYFGAVTLEAGAGIYLFFLAIMLLCLWGLGRRAARFLHARSGDLRSTGSGDLRSTGSGDLRSTGGFRSTVQKLVGPTEIGLGVLALQALAYLFVMVVNYGVMDRLPGPAQGRHLYPAIAAISIVLALGFSEVFRSRLSLSTGALSAGMLAVSICCLPIYILPGYGAPLPVRTTAYPDVQYALDAALGHDLTLVGYDMPETEIAAGSMIPLSLYWHGLRSMARDYQFSVSLVDGNGAGSVLWGGHPAGGRYPTRAWDPGDYIRDSFDVVIPACIEPGHYDLVVTLWPGLPGNGEPLGRADLTSVEIVAGTEWNPAVVIDADLGDGLVLLGYDLVGASRDGDGLITVMYRETIGLTLYWRHEGTEGDRVPLTVTLYKADGQEWGRQSREPVGQGPFYCARYLFTVGPRTPAGHYRVKLRALGLGKVEFDIPVQVINRERIFVQPPTQKASGVTFGNCIVLEGYDVGERPTGSDEKIGLTAGDELGLTLYWRALCPIKKNYTVFVHLIDANEEILAQDDKLPGLDYATIFWTEGEVVQDQYRLKTDIHLPPGSCRVEVGLYRALDGQRLPIRDASGIAVGDRWILAQVQVVER
ncbi:MAG: glycosyltransferase family 39 protein [Anaerolineae bacterium]|nr:glycosyltransferase family 39 protein [Anaerolineae bacterium]